MKTIILSDMALLGLDYQSTKDGILYLKLLQSKGYKLVTLTNRPELCMRKIGAHVSLDGKVKYQYLGSCETKGNGLDIIFLDDEHVIEEINLKYDYTIFGNGICAFNNQDELIYQGEFISRDVLEEMIATFRKHGYKSYGEFAQLQKDSFGDRCFKGREDVYKFFTPAIGTTEISDNIYGMQCSSRSIVEDAYIIKCIQDATPSIVGYTLNGKPCFYQDNVNKLVALNYLANNYGINIADSIILLKEITDNVINSEYKADNLIEDSKRVQYGPINPVLKKVI